MNKITALLAMCLVVTPACASRGGVRDMPEASGEEMHFTGSARAAALSARNAVAATSLEIVEAGREDDAWYLIAWGPGAEYVRVRCEPVAPDVVAVRIASRRRVPFDGRNDWAETLFTQMELELDTVDRIR